MTVKFWLGVFLGALSMTGLTLSALVLFAVLKLCLRRHGNPVYLMSATHLMCDCAQLVLAVGYLVPSIILNSWLFEGGRTNIFVRVFSTILLFCWNYCSIVQMFIAVNRLVVVCFSSLRFFSFKVVLIIVIFLCPLAAVTVYLTQYVMPCCRSSYDHTVLSYSYAAIEGVPNYSDKYIDLPLNVISSAVCAICYVYIIFFVWRMRSQYKLDLCNGRAKLKEFKYALQFCAISFYYVVVLVTFRVFPVLLGPREVEFYVITSICVTLNASANAVVYITYNSEVKKVIFSKESIISVQPSSRTTKMSRGAI